MNVSSKKGDYVIVLHGIFRTSSHMQKIAMHLESEGFDVINLDYPSTDYPLEDLIEIIHQDIQKHIVEDKPIHFVGYSMGGLLLRGLLEKYPPQNLGRVVQLAPPNKGSEVADFLKSNWLYKKLYGPAGQQLTTDQTEILHLLGHVHYELGVVSGSRSLDPICSLLIKGQSDGKVSIESTKIEGMKDHIIVKGTHTFFPRNKEVQRQAAHFLKYGEFNHDSC